MGNAAEAERIAVNSICPDDDKVSSRARADCLKDGFLICGVGVKRGRNVHIAARQRCPPMPMLEGISRVIAKQPAEPVL